MVPTDTCMLAFAGMVDDIPVCVTHGHSNGCTLWSMLDDNEVWSTFVDPISYPDKSDQTGLVWSGWSLGGSVGWRSVIQAGNKQQQWCNGQLIFNLTFLSMKFIRTKKNIQSIIQLFSIKFKHFYLFLGPFGFFFLFFIQTLRLVYMLLFIEYFRFAGVSNQNQLVVVKWTYHLYWWVSCSC